VEIAKDGLGALPYGFASACFAISAEAQTMISDNPATEQELGVHLYENELDYSIALQPWKGDYDGMIQRKMMNWDL